MHGRGPNAFQKPPSVIFTFRQKRFDKTGDVVDDRGETVYRLRDAGEDHSFGFMKTYPLEVHRAASNSVAFSIEWHSGPTKSTVKGLGGNHGEIPFVHGLMNDDLQWSMPDGSKFEWEGVWGYPFNLLDYRIEEPYSLSPAVVAKFRPRPTKKDYSTLEVHRDALNVPGFLDYLVATITWLEYKRYDDAQRREANATGTNLGSEIGAALG